MDDKPALDVASRLIREIGYVPVLVDGLKSGGHLMMPGSPLSGERAPDEVRRIAATLQP